jgi:hypothetical protein
MTTARQCSGPLQRRRHSTPNLCLQFFSPLSSSLGSRSTYSLGELTLSSSWAPVRTLEPSFVEGGLRVDCEAISPIAELTLTSPCVREVTHSPTGTYMLLPSLHIHVGGEREGREPNARNPETLSGPLLPSLLPSRTL